VLAFFELPTKPEMGRDPNTPDWVQHIAFKVKDRPTLLQFREHLEANGVEVLGVTDLADHLDADAGEQVLPGYPGT